LTHLTIIGRTYSFTFKTTSTPLDQLEQNLG